MGNKTVEAERARILSDDLNEKLLSLMQQVEQLFGKDYSLALIVSSDKAEGFDFLFGQIPPSELSEIVEEMDDENFSEGVSHTIN